MRKFTAIKIIHDTVHRLDFLFLAEFFRFMGIFVGEDTIYEFDPEESSNKKCFEIFIFAGRREKEQKVHPKVKALAGTVDKFIVQRNLFPPNTIYLEDILRDAGIAEPEVEEEYPKPVYEINAEISQIILKKCMKQIFCKLFGGEGELQGENRSEGFSNLIIVFVEHELWKHSANLQYFPKRISDPVEKAKEKFLAAYNKLESINSAIIDQEIRSYYEYAYFWCATRVNSACDYMQQMLYFPIEKLAERCQNFCLEYSDFVNARVLLGLCYEQSPSSANEAVYAFKEALNQLDGECYSTAVYYWIGKRYESFKTGREEAEKNYRKAYELRPKYRNIFKVAIYERDTGNYKLATGRFEEIIQKLKGQFAINFADPLELEYAFKTYSQKCFIYFEQGDSYMDVIVNGEKAIDIKQIIVKNNKFYESFYGEDAEEYRKLSISRMNLKNVYWMLAVTYSKLLEEEKAKSYWEKYEGKQDEK